MAVKITERKENGASTAEVAVDGKQVVNLAGLGLGDLTKLLQAIAAVVKALGIKVSHEKHTVEEVVV